MSLGDLTALASLASSITVLVSLLFLGMQIRQGNRNQRSLMQQGRSARNVELLSRYGSEETAVDLDRLGGGAWQSRKARMKRRILEIAHDLIKIAAERQLRQALSNEGWLAADDHR